MINVDKTPNTLYTGILYIRSGFVINFITIRTMVYRNILISSEDYLWSDYKDDPYEYVLVFYRLVKSVVIILSTYWCVAKQDITSSTRIRWLKSVSDKLLSNSCGN